MAVSDTTRQTVVIDNGSGSIRAGFAGDDSPKSVFPTVTAIPGHGGVVVGMGKKEGYVGLEALAREGQLPLKYPIEQGIITRLDDMERVWHHSLYNELRVDPLECPVLLSEPALNPTDNREKITQVWFETFQAPALYLANQGVLSLYTTGRTFGLTLNSGYGTTQIVPVDNGYCINDAVFKLDIGGNHLTEYMSTMLHRRDIVTKKDVCNDIKEKLGSVALDFDDTTATSSHIEPKSFTLPDGQTVAIGNEQIDCPEALFKPTLLGLDSEGIQNLVYDSVMKCDVCIRNGLFKNIVLAGGSTLFPGFEDRLKKEITSLAPISMTSVNIVAPDSELRKNSVWIGGSILASLSTFKDLWITKQEYEESGPSIVSKKCV